MHGATAPQAQSILALLAGNDKALHTLLLSFMVHAWVKVPQSSARALQRAAARLSDKQELLGLEVGAYSLCLSVCFLLDVLEAALTNCTVADA